MTDKTIAQQVIDAYEDLENAVAAAETERLAAIRAEVEAQRQAEKDAIDPLKIGERRYLMVGGFGQYYLIIGAPRVGGERWVTVAPVGGGPMASYPEAEFRAGFYEKVPRG